MPEPLPPTPATGNGLDSELSLLDRGLNALSDMGNGIVDTIGNFNARNDDTDLLQNDYAFRTRVFPSDINHDYIGHYMVININVPVHADGQPRGSTRVLREFTAVRNQYSKVDVLRFGNIGSMEGEQNAAAFSFPRSTRRLKESIALFMPNPMVFTDINEYEEVSLTGLVNGTVSSTLSYLSGMFGLPDGGKLFNSFSEVAGTMSGLTGYPINPRVEIVFATTRQRQFVFEILMAPRNEEESENIKQIVQTLRFHSKPELMGQGFQVAGIPVGVPLYIPPAEFDITFFNKGVENTNIPRISTCVLERIDVDYAPTGVFSTFRNGHPVAVRMSLGFREVEPLHKLRVIQGF